MDNKLKLRTFLEQLLADYGVEAAFGDDDLLVSTGLLDSQAVLQMVVFLENEFGVDLGERGFDQNDFDSLTSMLGLINGQR
jgi:acyl carrier protein